jgi:hypothetical protein
MSKMAVNSRASRWYSCVVIALLGVAVAGCDRGAGEQVAYANKFASAIVVNNEAMIDSMIATARLKEHFDNQFTRAELIQWVSTFYDKSTKRFRTKTSADVDDNFINEVAGGMLRPGEIEETGKVRVRAPIKGDLDAYFWMVKQKGRPWGVAMITKGEMKVHFK